MGRLQNNIAGSSLTLPTMCVVTTLLWWLPQGGYSTDYLLGWLACVMTTYVVIETAAANALLRIRSRMVSSLLLATMAACGFLHPLQPGTMVLLCMAISFYCLLRTCERERPETDTLHAYLFLSLGSLAWPPLLLLAVVYLWSQGIYLRSLQRRSFGAALCGLLLPYAFWATAAFALADMQPFVAHASAIIAPVLEPFAWQWVVELAQSADWRGFVDGGAETLRERCLPHVAECSAFVLMTLVGTTGFVHYLRRSFDDKIRVRVCHYVFLTMQLVVFLWMVLQPHHFRQLFPLLALTTAPSAAHFAALTHTWLTNLWFIVLALGFVAVGVCCLVLPWVNVGF